MWLNTSLSIVVIENWNFVFWSYHVCLSPKFGNYKIKDITKYTHIPQMIKIVHHLGAHYKNSKHTDNIIKLSFHTKWLQNKHFRNNQTSTFWLIILYIDKTCNFSDLADTSSTKTCKKTDPCAILKACKNTLNIVIRYY